MEHQIVITDSQFNLYRNKRWQESAKLLEEAFPPVQTCPVVLVEIPSAST